MAASTLQIFWNDKNRISEYIIYNRNHFTSLFWLHMGHNAKFEPMYYYKHWYFKLLFISVPVISIA